MDQTQLVIPDFNEKFRGYDIDEVNAYLAQVGEQLAALASERDEALQRISWLEGELRRTREEVERAAANAAAAATAAPTGAEAAGAEAARILSLASETAERAIAEARNEAARIVSEANASAEQTQREARTEADRVVGEARVSAEQMIQKATEQAAQEYGARRDEILAEIGALETQRSTAATQLAAVESRVEEYRNVLKSISDNIGQLLDDPDKMLRPPIPGIELPAPAQFVEPGHVAPSPTAVTEVPTSAIAPITAEVVDGPPSDDTSAGSGFDGGYERADEASVRDDAPGAFEPEAGSSAAYVADEVPAPAYVDSPEAEESVDPSSFVVDPVADGGDAFGEATDWPPDRDWEQPVSEAGSSYDAPAAHDTWGPGSWSEVAGVTPTDDAFRAAPQADYGSDAFADPDEQAASGSTFPSSGLPTIGADRYTRELDEALNRDDEDDEAMARFFEADDQRQTRRFGRRR